MLRKLDHFPNEKLKFFFIKNVKNKLVVVEIKLKIFLIEQDLHLKYLIFLNENLKFHKSD
jgi:hypothetical protein